MTNTKSQKYSKSLIAQVISNKMQKTIKVTVEQKLAHPKYGKYIRRRTNLFAHDENNVCKIGDYVLIKECKPISKNKNWVLVELLLEA